MIFAVARRGVRRGVSRRGTKIVPVIILILKNNRGELVEQPHGLGCFQIFSLTLRAETIRSVFRGVRSLGAALDASLSGYGPPLFPGHYWRSRPSRTAAM